MAKDPAFLFYSSDFLTGTTLFTHEQRGIYIYLLCIQHQHGGIAEQDMINICGTHLQHIIKKFDKNEYGIYTNERLKIETEKRAKYSESRRNNRLSDKPKANPVKKSRVSKSYVRHMENENENIIVVNVEGGVGETKPTEDKILTHWQRWKKYKKDQHGFKFKSEDSEKTALAKLVAMSGNDEVLALAIIEKSIANGYSGLFEWKEPYPTNGVPKIPVVRQVTVKSAMGIEDTWDWARWEKYAKTGDTFYKLISVVE